MTWSMPIGAQADANGTRFRVWATRPRRVEVLIYDGTRIVAAHELAADGDGYFAGYVAGVRPGTRYAYRLDNGPPRPDPASRFQPEGVHSPSQVVDPTAFAWSDASWHGVPRDELVVYELHVGTATHEGTFDALIARLDDIRALGATVIELMPVADFPGARNWGYDGVNLFAPARAYGGPEGLRRLVDAAHARGLGVLLDVVYNHLGPDGNYLRDFSRQYFTDLHHTPWGEALNFDGPMSGPVREFFIANACAWAHEFHIDGLRFDATDQILDDSPTHVLAELSTRLHASLPEGRLFLGIAENDRNSPQVVSPVSAGGWGCDAVWSDDFHHQVRVALTGDTEAYFADFSGNAADLAATLTEGWFYHGQHSAFRKRPRGAPARDIDPPAFVYCIQNHDHVGNRPTGERLNHVITLDAFRAASALLLLSPYTPLLWMGQEWAASSPFQFFTDHHRQLGRLVTEGRRKEFAHFTAFSGKDVPDPQDPATFLRSKLRWEERATEPHRGVLQLYHDLLALRRSHPALRRRDRAGFSAAAVGSHTVALRRAGPAPADTLLALFNLRGVLELDLSADAHTAAPDGYGWVIALSSEDQRYGGQNGVVLGEGGTRLVFNSAGAVVLALAAR